MAAAYGLAGTVVASANNVANPTALAATAPAGRAVGDLLLLITTCRSITATVAAPAGWTVWPGFPKRSGTASGGSIYVFYRTADGTASDNATATWTGVATTTTGDSSQAHISTVTGADNASPSDQTVPAPTDASAANPSIPSITTQTADALVLGIAMKISDTAQNGTIANSFIERVDSHTTTGTGHLHYVATRAMPTAGATGASTVTAGNATAARCLSVPIAIKALAISQISGVDSYALSESASVAISADTVDSVSFADATPAIQTDTAAAEAFAFSDAAALISQEDKAGSESFALSESAGLQGLLTAADTVALAEVVAMLASTSAAESFAFTDAALMAEFANKVASDAFAFGELANLSELLLKSVSDVVTFSEFAQASEFASFTASESFTLTEALDVSAALALADTLTLAESVSKFETLLLSASETVTLSEALALAANAVASDALLLTEAAEASEFATKVGSDSLALSENAAILEQIFKAASDTLTASEGAVLSASVEATDAQTFDELLTDVAAQLAAQDNLETAEIAALAAVLAGFDSFDFNDISSLNTAGVPDAVQVLGALVTAAMAIRGVVSVEANEAVGHSVAEQAYRGTTTATVD